MLPTPYIARYTAGIGVVVRGRSIEYEFMHLVFIHSKQRVAEIPLFSYSDEIAWVNECMECNLYLDGGGNEIHLYFHFWAGQFHSGNRVNIIELYVYEICSKMWVIMWMNRRYFSKYLLNNWFQQKILIFFYSISVRYSKICKAQYSA